MRSPRRRRRKRKLTPEQLEVAREWLSVARAVRTEENLHHRNRASQVAASIRGQRWRKMEQARGILTVTEVYRSGLFPRDAERYLLQTGGNVKRAAVLAGCTPRYFRYLLDWCGLRGLPARIRKQVADRFAIPPRAA